MTSKIKYLTISLIILIAVCILGFELGSHKNSPPPATKTTSKTTTSTTASKPAPSQKTTPAQTPSYYVGSTQKDGNISITLDDTGGGTSMEQIPANDTIFSVDITVTNNGSTPFDSKDAFVGLSSVYTQIGTDTSTGLYNPAYATPCFGGGDVTIPAGQTVKGCVQFMVPKNALVDTYFYDKLKWYL
jgi:hypothetical protein